ncbi:aspartate-semialdehyde dehydrogenase [Paraferrimonas sp. SM1919]|uniref:aspartate-semialdehyde dehydrogenase n=1 Tax=Paraferrimonas sp. SM1919 TaxID=2662263 RepID=UPI0013D6BC16|nr:aspartate-semialdehyde dehydrogenase [Paraferrimonas sp. SM1919]
MSQLFNVAILGANGAVGKTLLELLPKRNFPFADIFPLASSRSAGKTVEIEGDDVEIIDVETFDWSQVQIAFFSAGSEASKKWAPIAAEAGVVVIDNTSQFRQEYDIPLVIPEVNSAALVEFRNHNIISNPNCSTIQMLVALKPIYDRYGIERINVATYQSVSGAGNSGISELASQCTTLLQGQPVEAKTFSRQIAFNVIPQIDEILDNGFTKEEMKMVNETHKIFSDQSIEVNPTAVRVPVFYGHSLALHIETTQPVDVAEAKELLSNAPGIVLQANDSDYPTAVGDAVGVDKVHVGRVRADLHRDNALNLWVVADNVRKGAALNSIQIAEELIANYY